ncbi:MAG: sulfur oxidation c-type cytochrome SoxX [Hydrogenophaga sp.]|jgi:sulfur-oxidizing protein SoxX|uniref:sulfur oxidation c-type cytochrome SoxX n=1 Tax=Hydrogenophaga sp. TaxID=1904254 RepID=UPI00272754F3|nr:sulfur oxidation c-type cytochrome SoxX [Hydrogenophaga sp.]MDO9483579.1 sulfur oxidation c-type cytochrome SoxX [Hydrogenophaga sp.]MDO9567954.1 sulfur oxidation c-type cytochrome SoxX [Hydrogenophaga sp.]MDP1892779.1 sulfur oxidation c-type cytochrome SoxX [Hydrogenophaga sp.]MDP2096289.1 sulfur oxidation c-type cytochrome SoxX [Hydrogenophaga sp.]MDP3346159.1 sulfur oxidation c-type cytochrome SoxX [Hydrogenophaga sp.]
MKTTMKFALLPLAALVLAGCTSSPSGADYDKITADVVKASFQDRGIAKLDRLQQDDANRECSAADVAGKPLDEKVAKAIEEANLKTVKWPSDGKFLGDWKEGEKIAQSGRGLTWSDKADAANGGNCYNCHMISQAEISFGNLGPSLYNYGKLRGVTDPNAAASKAIVEYTWGKLWNARAYNACSQMPRAGHMGILSEKQIQHVMALLLDPASPVNK